MQFQIIFIQVNCVYGGGETFIETHEALVEKASTIALEISSPSTPPPPDCLLNKDGDFWSPNKKCSFDCIIGAVKLEFPDFCCCYYIDWMRE